MDKDYLVLKRASASRLSGEWSDDDYDVLAEGIVVGRIMKAAAAPVGQPWLWTLAYGQHEDRSPIYGYELTREAAIAAFAKSWNDRLRPLQQPPIGIGSSLEEPAPVSLVTHKGGSNAEVMALHHCPRDPWVSRWLSRGCNGPN